MTKKFQLSLIFIASTCLFACSSTSPSSNESAANSAPLSLEYNTQTIAPVAKSTATSALNDISLSMEQIMADPDWLGRQPESPQFSPTGEHIIYARKREGSIVRDLFVTNAGEGNGSLLALEDEHRHHYDEIIDDDDFSFVAWIYEGNVFAQQRNGGGVVQLTRDSSQARNLRYFQTGGVSYQAGNRFVSVDVATGKQSEVFNWSFAEAPEPVKEPADYIAKEQQKLIQYVQIQRANRQARFDQEQARAKANASIVNNTFYFDEKHTNVLASLSPDGRFAIVVTRENKPRRDDSDIMPDYIEENGRIKAQSVRQRVADAKSESHDIYFLDIQAGTTKKLGYQTLPGYNEDVLADVKRENAEAKGETYTNNRLPRDIGLLFDWYATEMPVKWHDDGEHVALMLEAWDNKDRWIVSVDVSDPKFITQHRMHDKAWVNYRFNQFDWFDESLTLFLLSEETGYSQLFVKPLNGEIQQITKGRYVVDDVVLSDDDRYFYYKANKKHPGIYEVYRSPAAGGKSEMLTDFNGMTDFVLSPKEDRLLLTHSSLSMPPELYTLRLDGEANPQKLTNTISEAFLSIDWTVPSIVPVPSSHTEQPIYSRVYTPSGTSTEKRRAVVFNHGAGYLQNAHLGWSGYFREFMFHSLLVSKGYVVLDMDFRASAGYGRDWRTAIYRQMGTPEVQDLKDGVDWLVENANVDRQRIGTYGGSYGGFLTFMALFNEPELFQAGAALRPVSDWAHYNLPYTSNILNTPDLDPIAYERSSPIYFAEGLNKPLLMNAPMVDDNVFFVDVVRLVQRLIELEKEDFETAIYPVEPHGFIQPSSWLDEYRRIYKLFEDNL